MAGEEPPLHEHRRRRRHRRQRGQEERGRGPRPAVGVLSPRAQDEQGQPRPDQHCRCIPARDGPAQAEAGEDEGPPTSARQPHACERADAELGPRVVRLSRAHEQRERGRGGQDEDGHERHAAIGGHDPGQDVDGPERSEGAQEVPHRDRRFVGDGEQRRPVDLHLLGEEPVVQDGGLEGDPVSGGDQAGAEEVEEQRVVVARGQDGRDRAQGEHGHEARGEPSQPVGQRAGGADSAARRPSRLRDGGGRAEAHDHESPDGRGGEGVRETEHRQRRSEEPLPGHEGEDGERRTARGRREAASPQENPHRDRAHAGRRHRIEAGREDARGDGCRLEVHRLARARAASARVSSTGTFRYSRVVAMPTRTQARSHDEARSLATREGERWSASGAGGPLMERRRSPRRRGAGRTAAVRSVPTAAAPPAAAGRRGQGRRRPWPRLRARSSCSA